MELSKEQQLAFDKYVQGHNIFITGPGGAGKSALIRMINQDAYKKFKDIIEKHFRDTSYNKKKSLWRYLFPCC